VEKEPEIADNKRAAPLPSLTALRPLKNRLKLPAAHSVGARGRQERANGRNRKTSDGVQTPRSGTKIIILVDKRRSGHPKLPNIKVRSAIYNI